jgi:hypothetical protein
VGWERIGLAVAIVAFAAIYARTVGFPYVWDDVEAIAENPILEGPLLEGLFATQHDHLDPALRKLSGLKPAHDSYRPLLYLSYRGDVALFGMSPRAMHLHNVILGIACILAFYFVAIEWLATRAAVLPATVIFALHPLQVESVAYVSARGDLLAALFALMSVVCAFRFARGIEGNARRGPQYLWFIASTVSFVASLLCKEAYVGLPLAFAGVALARGIHGRRAIIGAWLAAAFVYLLVRFMVGGVAGGGIGASALVALPGVFLRYLQIALLPFDLSTERLYDPAYVVPGWVAVLTIGLGIVATRGRRWSHAAGVFASGLWWMLVLLGPSVIVVLLMGIVADRYAYLPLAGFAITVSSLLATVVQKQSRLRAPLGAALAVWAAMCLTITVIQVGVWKDNSALYSHAVVATPQSSMAHYRLGYAYAQERQWERALPLFARAVELDSSNVRALNNLGVAYLNAQKYEEAADFFERALAESGQMHFRAWYNLGVATINMGDEGAACEHVARALQINPNYEAAAAFREANCR